MVFDKIHIQREEHLVAFSFRQWSTFLARHHNLQSWIHILQHLVLRIKGKRILMEWKTLTQEKQSFCLFQANELFEKHQVLYSMMLSLNKTLNQCSRR